MMLSVLLCFFGLISTIFAGVPMTPTSLFFVDTSEIIANVNDSRLQIQAVFESSEFGQWQTIEVYHRNILTSVDRILGSIADYTSQVETVSGYNVTVETISMVRRGINLLIELVQFQDDGTIIFNVLTNSNLRPNYTIERNLTVQKPLDSLWIQYDSMLFTSSPTSTIEVDAGNATVKCIAGGSSPATTNITLTLDEVEIAFDGNTVVEVASGERKYTTTESALIDVQTKNNELQTLKCVATDELGQTLSIQLIGRVSSAQESLSSMLGLVVFQVIVIWLHNF